MEQVAGEDGVSLEDFAVMEASKFLDMVFLQQDAFDDVDSSMSLERQKQLFDRVYAIVTSRYRFADKEAARGFFTRMTGLFKNLNYAAPDAPDFERFAGEIDALATSVPVT
jgi:V/A-type H+-transporting ATPase subunit A